jgi:hypothetical protein
MLGLYSTNKKAEYFFTGDMSGYYGATDANDKKGTNGYVEEADGGCYL